MNRLLLSVAIACALTSAAHAQVEVKTVGGAGEEYGYNIWPTADGGFYTAGTQETSPGSGQSHFWVARFDAQTTTMWEKTYGDAGVSETHFGSSETPDGGLMFGGFTGQQFSGNESAILFRIDGNGDTLWREQIDYKSSDHFHFMIERREGGYYFGGHTDSKTDANGNMWLLRLDSARHIIWEKEYDNGSGEHAHWGIETRDGGALMLGHTDATGREKFWLVKVDSNGVKQWDKVYSSSPSLYDSPYRVFETREGNYALVGGSSSTTRGQAWLLVVDTTGAVLIDKHFGDPNSDTFTWSGSQTSDGGFILAGYTTYTSKGAEDAYIVKTYADGSLDWEKIVGGGGSDVVYDVIERANAYVAVGETLSPEYMTGGNGDMMLVMISKPSSSTAIADDASTAMSMLAAPNPAMSRTTIDLRLRESGTVDLRVVDLLGRTVATLIDGEHRSGDCIATFDASSLTPGVYVCRARLTTIDGRTITTSVKVAVTR